MRTMPSNTPISEISHTQSSPKTCRHLKRVTSWIVESSMTGELRYRPHPREGPLVAVAEPLTAQTPISTATATVETVLTAADTPVTTTVALLPLQMGREYRHGSGEENLRDFHPDLLRPPSMLTGVTPWREIGAAGRAALEQAGRMSTLIFPPTTETCPGGRIGTCRQEGTTGGGTIGGMIGVIGDGIMTTGRGRVELEVGAVRLWCPAIGIVIGTVIGTDLVTPITDRIRTWGGGGSRGWRSKHSQDLRETQYEDDQH